MRGVGVIDNPLVAGATAALFGGLSRLRGRRVFHPEGVGFEAELKPLPEALKCSVLFDDPRPRASVVRLSRSLGLPEGLHDPCGLAIRVTDAYGHGRHQDFLLVTSGRSPIARHLLLPSGGFAGRNYSSLLPYRIGGETLLVGAEPAESAPGPSLGELRTRDRGELTFLLTVASPTGEWRPAASLRLGARLSPAETERLRFDPAHSGGGIDPIGILNRLRTPAYRGSQEGRRPFAVFAPPERRVIG